MSRGGLGSDLAAVDTVRLTDVGELRRLPEERHDAGLCLRAFVDLADPVGNLTGFRVAAEATGVKTCRKTNSIS